MVGFLTGDIAVPQNEEEDAEEREVAVADNESERNDMLFVFSVIWNTNTRFTYFPVMNDLCLCNKTGFFIFVEGGL